MKSDAAGQPPYEIKPMELSTQELSQFNDRLFRSGCATQSMDFYAY